MSTTESTRTAPRATAGAGPVGAGPVLAGPVLAGAPAAVAADLLARAREGLGASRAATSAGERYVAAHLSALRSAAAVLAVRGRPRRGAVLGVWDVLPRVAPELAEWALLFAAGAPRRAAVEAGRAGAVTARDADDLLRDAEAFAGVVASGLGLGPGLPGPGRPVPAP